MLLPTELRWRNCGLMDLNRRPSHYECAALTTELNPQTPRIANGGEGTTDFLYQHSGCILFTGSRLPVFCSSIRTMEMSGVDPECLLYTADGDNLTAFSLRPHFQFFRTLRLGFGQLRICPRLSPLLRDGTDPPIPFTGGLRPLWSRTHSNRFSRSEIPVLHRPVHCPRQFESTYYYFGGNTVIPYGT